MARKVPIVGMALMIVALALYRLRGSSRYPFDLPAAMHGVSTVIATTGPAAVLTWLVLAVTLSAIGRWLRRASDLTPAETAAAATVLLWSGAYVALFHLGPFGLYRPFVLRALLALTVVLALCASVSLRPLHSWRLGWGGFVAVGAFALVAGPLLLLQLGSPVSPFMDVLPYVASTQKIVTFQFYDPLANDAAGIWPPSRQVPGVDGIFSLLALVTGSSAALAITSSIVPVAAFSLLATYLLGRNVKGGLTGGMACLFLLQTFLWRRSADVRSTALAFPLVAIGLAFLLGHRREGYRVALGGVTLGLAVAVNPLIGAFGMQVAALAIIVEWLDFRRGFVLRGLALVGGGLGALPTVLIGLTIPTPHWVLLMPMLGGCGLLIALVMRGREQGRDRPTAWARGAVVVGAPLLALYLHAGRGSELMTDDWLGYPVLALCAVGGLAVLAVALWRQPTRWPAAALPALALIVAMVDFMLVSPWRFQGALDVRAMASEVISKIAAYWVPYWLALLAGVWFSMLARQWSRVAAVTLAFLLVLYPVRHVVEPLDYGGDELSVPMTWGFHLTHAARGYWAGRGDRRWVLGDNYQAVADALRDEIAAGRIDYYTHVLVIAPNVETVELALATGISADVVSPTFNPASAWNLGSRVRSLDAVDAALAERPRYVVLEQFPPTKFPQLTAYEPMVVRPSIQLYRARSDAS